jgi:hypothetical protein
MNVIYECKDSNNYFELETETIQGRIATSEL